MTSLYKKHIFPALRMKTSPMVTAAGALKVWFQWIHQSIHLMASAYQIFDNELCIANISTMN